MTTGGDETSATEDSRASRKHRRDVWLRAAIASLAIIVIGTGIGWITYAAAYQPLRDGSGSIGAIGAAKAVSDGFGGETGVMLVGPAGSRGGEVMSIENDGRFSVTLLPNPDGGGPVYSWLPAGDLGHTLAHILAAARPLPATIKPHAAVYVLVMTVKPNCTNASGLTFSGPEIRTEALGFHHWYSFPTGHEGGFVPVYACPSKRQIARAITP